MKISGASALTCTQTVLTLAEKVFSDKHCLSTCLRYHDSDALLPLKPTITSQNTGAVGYTPYHAPELGLDDLIKTILAAEANAFFEFRTFSLEPPGSVNLDGELYVSTL